MKVLVTGGAGFIGSHLVDLLVSQDHDVAVVDNLIAGRRSNVNERARLYIEDVRSHEFRRVVARERPQVVFHQAAQTSVGKSMDDPLYDAEVNVIGLVNVLESCTAATVRKVVFASSGATYGNPDYLPLDEDHPLQPASPYGIAKLVAEHYLAYYRRHRGLEYTALRYGNVYGPRQDVHGEAGVIAAFITDLLAGRTPTMHWDGKQLRDYVYVSDVARANLLASAPGAGDGATYCISAGVGTTVNTIYAEVCRILAMSVTPVHAPRRPGDLRAAYFDAGRAERELGWKANVSLADGLVRTAAAFWAEMQQTDVISGAVIGA
jgi:UDP-glucose 4-epimerase